jgi:hypothetical protein
MVVKNVIGASDRPSRVGAVSQRDRHPRFNTTLFQNTEIPTGAPISHIQADQLMHASAPGELPARLSRLAHVENHRADAQDVADTHRFFTQARDGEIFAERAARHIRHA